MKLESLSRRRFLQLGGASAGGLVLAAALDVQEPLAGVLDEPAGASLNLFVNVLPDGQVEIIAHRSEMGTGIRTSLPQVVADEMEADWHRVHVIQGLANANYGSQNTDGSRSIRNFYQVMRRMGAAARVMLEGAAAQRWGVPAEQCTAREHRVYHRDGRHLDFGELANAASELPLPDLDTLRLKDKQDFRYIGKDVPSVDLRDMSCGNTTFGVDVHLPGMLYASIERSPVMDGRVKSFNAGKAQALKGVVEVVEINASPMPAGYNPIAGVAVVASDTYSAMKGRAALDIEWQSSEHSQHDSERYLDGLVATVSQGPGETVRERGDIDAALDAADQLVEAVYRTPYLAHASMEPPMATAHLHDGICEVWACTQTPQAAQREVARVLGLETASVVVHVTLLGGGFGRKSKPDYVLEAAILARKTGKPVQVVWTREDDIRHDYFHSCAAQLYRGALDKKGSLTGWLAREAVPPIDSIFTKGAEMMGDGALSQCFGPVPFAVPNLRLERHPAPAHVRIGWLRSVFNIPFCFGVSSFVDELAHAAKRDPAEFWLEAIGDDRRLDFANEGFEYSNHGKSLEEYPFETGRLKNVIREVTSRGGWGKKLPANQGLGLAAQRSFLSYVAVICKVEVADDSLRVLEMHCVIDAGTVVNPDRVHAQLEGAMIFGLSLALMGEISFSNGVADQSNFHDYPIARVSQVPETIATHIIPSDAPPAGVGEPGVPPVAPAIANAVFAATGKRIRQLPLSKELRV